MLSILFIGFSLCFILRFQSIIFILLHGLVILLIGYLQLCGLLDLVSGKTALKLFNLILIKLVFHRLITLILLVFLCLIIIVVLFSIVRIGHVRLLNLVVLIIFLFRLLLLLGILLLLLLFFL
jgi:hypothetical protein